MIQIVSQKYKIEGVGNSMQGGRTENQDDLGCLETPLGFLLVVCDGMGGGPGGKTASYIVKQQMLETIVNCSPQSTPADAFKMAVDRAHTALEEKMQQMPELNGMGSTLVAVLINEHSATIAHLGDSRCYQVRGNRMVFRTKDHSLVGELVQNGAITEEQARTSPQSNVITRGLGSTTNHVAEIEEVPYKQGDRFILCTDGVWGIMPHNDLQMRLCSPNDVSTLVKELSAEVDKIGFSQGGRHDNHTLAVFEIKTDSILKQPMKKVTKSMLGICMAALLCSVIFNVVCLLKWGNRPQADALSQEVSSLSAENDGLVSELAERETDIIRLQESINNLKKAISASGDASQLQIAALTAQRDSLAKMVDSLNRVVAALKVQQNTAPKQESAHREPRTSTKQEENTKNATPSTPDSPKKVVEDIIYRFKSYGKAEGASAKVVQQKHKDHLTTIKQLLDVLEVKTNKRFTAEINNIRKQLGTKAFNPNQNVWPAKKDKKDWFKTSDETWTVIKGDIIPVLNNIKEKI